MHFPGIYTLTSPLSTFDVRKPNFGDWEYLSESPDTSLGTSVKACFYCIFMYIACIKIGHLRRDMLNIRNLRPELGFPCPLSCRRLTPGPFTCCMSHLPLVGHLHWPQSCGLKSSFSGLSVVGSSEKRIHQD